MGLADLPLELQWLLISFAEESGLKRLQLVCKYFEAIITPPAQRGAVPLRLFAFQTPPGDFPG
jgi:hypothetical protein